MTMGCHRQIDETAHFIPIRETCFMERLTQTYISKIVIGHGIPLTIVSDVIVDLNHISGLVYSESWGTPLPLVDFAYSNSCHETISMPPLKLCTDVVVGPRIAGKKRMKSH